MMYKLGTRPLLPSSKYFEGNKLQVSVISLFIISKELVCSKVVPQEDSLFSQDFIILAASVGMDSPFEFWQRIIYFFTMHFLTHLQLYQHLLKNAFLFKYCGIYVSFLKQLVPSRKKMIIRRCRPNIEICCFITRRQCWEAQLSCWLFSI